MWKKIIVVISQLVIIVKVFYFDEVHEPRHGVERYCSPRVSPARAPLPTAEEPPPGQRAAGLGQETLAGNNTFLLHVAVYFRESKPKFRQRAAPREWRRGTAAICRRDNLGNYPAANCPDSNSFGVVALLVSFLASTMLVKVRFREKQKYIKVIESDGTCDYQQFHQAVIEKFGLPPDVEIIYQDSSGTEVDPDIFSELLKRGEDLLKAYVNDDREDLDVSMSSEASYPSDASTVNDTPCPSKKIRMEDQSHEEAAKKMVNEVIQRKPGGEKIIEEYHKTQTLCDVTRRQLVNVLVADMLEVHGYVSRAFDG
ncbi:hypothetical protein N1851_015423 [Merluccius polli]|uniref:Uncharacterized protein n=1 Tax=Merluccius polli TaxID=89951 RepID=A0AA47P3P8_MERPO|nr:hypothetical protein N1851_015423 [Merluccius polli]